MPAQVQYLGPECLVCESGGDDEKRTVLAISTGMGNQIMCCRSEFPRRVGLDSSYALVADRYFCWGAPLAGGTSSTMPAMPFLRFNGHCWCRALKPYVKSRTLPLGAASVHWE
jgi:hypothetical protein